MSLKMCIPLGPRIHSCSCGYCLCVCFGFGYFFVCLFVFVSMVFCFVFHFSFFSGFLATYLSFTNYLALKAFSDCLDLYTKDG